MRFDLDESVSPDATRHAQGRFVVSERFFEISYDEEMAKLHKFLANGAPAPDECYTLWNDKAQKPVYMQFAEGVVYIGTKLEQKGG